MSSIASQTNDTISAGQSRLTVTDVLMPPLLFLVLLLSCSIWQFRLKLFRFLCSKNKKTLPQERISTRPSKIYSAKESCGCDHNQPRFEACACQVLSDWKELDQDSCGWIPLEKLRNSIVQGQLSSSIRQNVRNKIQSQLRENNTNKPHVSL